MSFEEYDGHPSSHFHTTAKPGSLIDKLGFGINYRGERMKRAATHGHRDGDSPRAGVTGGRLKDHPNHFQSSSSQY
ncbi:hypothetical protein PDE_03330 [Penicillium oxalicum 114-2]|uniref:Uncharacterized protein n=1 Tax=Penicillium oxalicum (strain 114-2 / CGMCC 5302) TaxID=933388 RepID=S7ZDP9_PENO1|nr:hypothetical protein PDE_03330 [Penicillium oxalicum 114-2]